MLHARSTRTAAHIIFRIREYPSYFNFFRLRLVGKLRKLPWGVANALTLKTWQRVDERNQFEAIALWAAGGNPPIYALSEGRLPMRVLRAAAAGDRETVDFIDRISEECRVYKPEACIVSRAF